ncbi:LuxR C-terminal-related transcriptional regulator [Jiangella sp. DSM 45060]|uniref:LuxR C-terminal-related transcriptional regulator n=1 Tax=Jiangella sp. DSM 45060 TaxID=1798224 RepID=UPI00087D94BD|nr:LuxR C-terminal-related transcriptional regulator [Jiangella sp. DSM 45060]SDT45778.1 LuxR family transcriptional regulator, maltose regulon positive regulatory protein [Jiangella sp. DSM 45060]
MAYEQAGARAFVTPTRLRVPRVPEGLVQRSRLIETGLGAHPVSLVCAPAGSGKTMLVADWARSAQEGGQPVAWLSIEDGDDRPYELWSAVIDALIEASSGAARRRLDGLSPPRQGVEPQFISALSDALHAVRPVRWLVLDDLQRIRNADVTAGLDLFLAELPPDVGMVLVCRSVPGLSVHRLRLDGALHEVGSADLAFTEPEAAAMFAGLGRPLGEADITRLVARTEGWAAGLRLAAVSLAAAPDTGAFISDFEGNQGAVGDYLFAEIVQHLPADQYDFLLRTCAPEQLSVELAAELSGRVDAGRLLDQLCRANALVVQSGDTSWYRYHSLMRGYLMATLAREDVDAPRAQHAATARWFVAQDQPLVALEHAVRAGDDRYLTDLVRAHGLRLILSGHAPVVRDALARAAPAVRNDTAVATVAVLAALDLAELPAVDRWFTVLDKQTTPSDPLLAAMQGSAVVQRALLGGDVAGALRETGLTDRERTGDADVDLIMLVHRAPARMRGGDYAGAIADLEKALALARAGRYDPFVLSALSQLSGINGAACDFPATMSWTRQAIEFATSRGWADSPRLAYAYLLAAWTAFQTGDDRAQADYADKAMHCLDGRGNVEVEVGVRSMYALATFEATTGPARHRAVADFRAIWQGRHIDEVSPALMGYATPQEIRLALAVGEPAWAVDAVERATRHLPDSAESLTMRAQLSYARGRISEAHHALAPVVRGEVAVHVATTVVVANVLTAVIDAAQGNDALSFEALRRALDWAAPRNFRRPFIEAWGDVGPLLVEHQGRFGHADSFAADLRDQLPQRTCRAVDASSPSRTLSPRELELLRDLPSPLSVREIAEARGVSINTTKTHLSAVYRKLGVTGRFAAIRVARSRGLL